MIKAVKKGDNVIVSKTFSKVYGMAGLRVGYLIAKPEIASNSGQVVYIDNRRSISRANDQVEDIKIVIEF